MTGFTKRVGLAAALAIGLAAPAGAATVLDTNGETAVFDFTGVTVGTAKTYAYEFAFDPATPATQSLVRITAYASPGAQGTSLTEFDLLPLTASSSTGAGNQPLEGTAVSGQAIPAGFFTDGDFSFAFELRNGGPISIASMTLWLCTAGTCLAGEGTAVAGVPASAATVPEPDGLALLGLGGLALLGARRARRRGRSHA